jgi:hypothetical protein
MTTLAGAGAGAAPLSPGSGVGSSKKIARGVANLFCDQPQIFAPVEATQVRSRTSGTSYWLKVQTPLYNSQLYVSNPQPRS